MRVGPVVPRTEIATAVAPLRGVRSPLELADRLATAALTLFECEIACVSLEGGARAEKTPAGPVRRAFSEYYDRSWRSQDPIVRVALSTHEPYDNGAVFESSRWHREPMFQAICEPSGLHHYLVVPLVGHGSPIGTLSVSRRKERRPFFDRDRVSAGALAGHASALFAEIGRLSSDSRSLTELTSAERETATLAADGYTVDAIALMRNVSRNTVKEALQRVYRKLRVASRVELVRRLGGA